jgi:hypothetical protein
VDAGPRRRIADGEHHFAALEQVARHPDGGSDVGLFIAPLAKWKIRECSRKRPTMERTRMRSESPFTPGRRVHTRG